jgi:PilZ domain
MREKSARAGSSHIDPTSSVTDGADPPEDSVSVFPRSPRAARHTTGEEFVQLSCLQSETPATAAGRFLFGGEGDWNPPRYCCSDIPGEGCCVVATNWSKCGRMQTETPRAQRLLISVPMTYRTPGDDEWLSGRVRNISESGVMFAPADLHIGQNIEVILSTPIPIQSIAPGRLFFSAKVVRTGPDSTAAAHFDECRYLLES